MKITVTLTPEEIGEIITNALKEKFPKVGKVKFKATQQLVGNQMHEHYDTVFTGAQVEVEG